MNILKFVILYIIFVLSVNFVGAKSFEENISLIINTDKGAYLEGDKCSSVVSIINKTSEKIEITDLQIIVKNISDSQTPVIYQTLFNQIFKINPKSSKKIEKTLIEKISKDYKKDAYGIFLSYKINGKKVKDSYQNFFRIINKNELSVFKIETEKINDVPIYKLDGGMSAEYVVEKSAENITAGISHSWKVNGPGSGPNHVLANPNFLEKSINETIRFYDQSLGNNAKIETVMISSGFPSIPYISNAFNALVLPLHFLVSVNTVKEVQSILTTSNNKGIASYATLSHDPSVPYAVAWIKLLELPKAYQDFIKRHQVKNVFILGATGTNGGETKAKQLFYNDNIKGEYADGSIYIMYPGTSPDDVETLKNKISDLKDFAQQSEFIRIADWESGISQKQLNNFTSDTKKINHSIKVTQIISEDLGRLYNLGAYCTVALMHKNKDKFQGIKGIIFNPYLISHPIMELKKGYMPLLYWQLVGANYTVDNLENNIFKYIKEFYPETDFKRLNLWLNSTRNFGAEWSANNLKKELIKKGYTRIIENDYQVDEVWDLSDNAESPSELLYKEMVENIGFKNLKVWKQSLIPLEIKDISTFSGIEINSK